MTRDIAQLLLVGVGSGIPLLLVHQRWENYDPKYYISYTITFWGAMGCLFLTVAVIAENIVGKFSYARMDKSLKQNLQASDKSAGWKNRVIVVGTGIGVFDFFAVITMLVYSNPLKLRVDHSVKGTELVITNLDNLDWEDLDIRLNRHKKDDDFLAYTYQFQKLSAGTTHTLPQREFVMADGTPFDDTKLKVVQLELEASTESSAERFNRIVSHFHHVEALAVKEGLIDIDFLYSRYGRGALDIWDMRLRDMELEIRKDIERNNLRRKLIAQGESESEINNLLKVSEQKLVEAAIHHIDEELPIAWLSREWKKRFPPTF